MGSVTQNTVKNLVLDAGVVYVNYGEASERMLGATMGGNTFTVEREIKAIEVDGIKGKVKGLRRVITENAMLTVNLKEMSPENIKLALGGSHIEDYPAVDPTHKKITSAGKIVETDYITNIALAATVSGSDQPAVVMLHNVLADGNFEVTLTDKEEAVVPIQFSAHYDPASIDMVPYEIRYPIVA